MGSFSLQLLFQKGWEPGTLGVGVACGSVGEDQARLRAALVGKLGRESDNMRRSLGFSQDLL